jgi:uncharacterized membrane protein/protein-disulfide isomerase
MSTLARRLLVACALLGLAASSAATYVHYNLIQNPDYSSFCDINATVSCKAAYLSRFGSFAGVPVAVGGVCFFAWVLLLLWGAGGKSRIQDSAPAYIFASSTLALAVVFYLAYASLFILKEVCPLCVATYAAVIGIFVISGAARTVPMARLPKRAVRDMRILVGTPAALIVTLLFVSAAAWGVSAFPRHEPAPAVQIQPLSEDKRSEFERWWDVQPTMKMPFEHAGTKVLIVEFADLQCPHCRKQYLAYEPILEKYADRPQEVTLLFRHWPFDHQCNGQFSGSPHPAACEAAAAIVMARARGTAQKLTHWLFEHQAELNSATVRRAAAEIGGIPDYDGQYAKAIQEVKTDASLGSALGVNGTPAYFVNGRRVPGGGLPPEYFQAAIDLELKRAR